MGDYWENCFQDLYEKHRKVYYENTNEFTVYNSSQLEAFVSQWRQRVSTLIFCHAHGSPGIHKHWFYVARRFLWFETTDTVEYKIKI